jgi:hypothetical protein
VGKTPLLFTAPALDQRAEMRNNHYPVLNVAGVKMKNMKMLSLDRSKNPYDLANLPYFEKRRKEMSIMFKDQQTHHLKLLKKQKGICPICQMILEEHDRMEVHHDTMISKGGKNTIANSRLVHYACHKVTHSPVNGK